jgi:hypothetical protein
MGVRGVPANAFDCALARYLSAILPAQMGIEEVAVGTTKKHRIAPSRLIIRQGSFPRWPIQVRLSSAIRGFLAEFDSYGFVGLLAERPSNLPSPTFPSRHADLAVGRLGDPRIPQTSDSEILAGR